MKGTWKKSLLAVMLLTLSACAVAACGDKDGDSASNGSTPDNSTPGGNKPPVVLPEEPEPEPVVRVPVNEITLGTISVGEVTFSGEEIMGTDDLLGGTKYEVSSDGKTMVIVTGLRAIQDVYEVGYEFGDYYTPTADDKTSKTEYYTSLTAGETEYTVQDIFGTDCGYEAMMVWEVAYDAEQPCAFYPYLYLGELVDGKLVKGIPEVEISPDESAKMNLENKWISSSVSNWNYGAEAKISFVSKYGQPTLSYFDAQGSALAEAPVDAGSYFVQATVAATSEYQGLQSEKIAFTIRKTTNAILGMENVETSVTCHYALSSQLRLVTAQHGEVETVVYESDKTTPVANVDQLSEGTYWVVSNVKLSAEQAENYDGATAEKKIVVTHSHRWTESAERDVYSCACGEDTVIFNKIAEAQYALATEGAVTLNLSSVGKGTVQSVSLDGQLLSTNSTVDFGELPIEQHGEKRLTVEILDEMDVIHTVTVPVFIVTAFIEDAAGIIALQPTAAKPMTYGCYVLKNNITIAPDQYARYCGWANSGFTGTFEGAGYTITANSSGGSNGSHMGIFGVLNGAKIQNVNFVEKAYTTNTIGHSLWAKAIYTSTFENINVTIEAAEQLDNITGKDVSGNTGMLCFGDVMNNTFKNINIYANSVETPAGVGALKIGTLFGRSNDGTNAAGVYINFKVYCDDLYEACHVNGRNQPILGDIEIVKTVKLATRVVIASQASNQITLSLGSDYANATVEKVLLGTTEIGKSLTVDISEMLSDKSKHGEYAYTVYLKKANGKSEVVMLPLAIATAEISNATQFKAILPKEANEKTTGYYVLTQDITLSTSDYAPTSIFNWKNGAAFGATLNGNGHSVTAQQFGFGIFTCLNGATFKNITFKDSAASMALNSGLLAKSSYDSVFDNVRFEIIGVTSDYETNAAASGINCGWLIFNACWNTAFSNVTIQSNGRAINSLFSSDLIADKVNQPTLASSFSNVKIYAKSLINIGFTKTKMYISSTYNWHAPVFYPNGVAGSEVTYSNTTYCPCQLSGVQLITSAE